MGFLKNLKESTTDTWDKLRSTFQQRRQQKTPIQKNSYRSKLYNRMSQQFGYASHHFSDDYTDQDRDDQTLRKRFVDYENMDDYAEVSAALNKFANEATKPDMLSDRRIWADGKNKNVVSDLNYFIHERLNKEKDIWGEIRYLAKTGNVYIHHLINNNGIVDTEPLPAALTRRVNNEHGQLMGFAISQGNVTNTGLPADEFRSEVKKRYSEAPDKDNWASETFKSYESRSDTQVFLDFEVSHIRLRGKDLMSEYGHSILEPARHDFRRLSMMEDAAVVYKLTRAQDRDIFYVDVGSMDGAEAMQHVQNAKDNYRKEKFVDSETGQVDFSYNPLAADEDLWIPKGDDGANIEHQQKSGSNYQAVEDLKYFRNKIGVALAYPELMDRQIDASKPLDHQNITFASKIMRLQRDYIEGYKKTCAIQLLATGRDPRDFIWDLHMTVPSAILELARVEVMSAKADIMKRLEKHVSVRWMLVELFGFSEEEATRLMVMRQDEKDWQKASDTYGQIQRDVLRNITQKQVDRKMERPDEDDGGGGGMFASRDFDKDKIAENAKLRASIKANKRAYGINGDQFTSGRDDYMNRQELLRDMQQNDLDLMERVNRTYSLLENMKQTSDFNKAA
jgi:hypothetical protein